MCLEVISSSTNQSSNKQFDWRQLCLKKRTSAINNDVTSPIHNIH